MRQKVIFVPGFNGGKRDASLIKYLLKKDFEVIYFKYDTSLKEDILKIAKKLDLFIKDLNLKKGEKANLIGLSAGGIIVDYYLKFINSKKIGKFVSISSPYKGTPLANLIGTFIKRKGLNELKIGSPTLKKINRKTSPLKGTNQKSIWSFFDFIVPGKSAKGKNPSHTMFFAHNVIQFWPPIILQIKKFLKEDETQKM